jgi:hypothetical protein
VYSNYDQEVPSLARYIELELKFGWSYIGHEKKEMAGKNGRERMGGKE